MHFFDKNLIRAKKEVHFKLLQFAEMTPPAAYQINFKNDGNEKVVLSLDIIWCSAWCGDPPARICVPRKKQQGGTSCKLAPAGFYHKIVMKKNTFLALAMTLPLIAASQPSRKWEKKPMSEFSNDTVAYIMHNFDRNDKNMKEYFKGKTIGDIIPELGFRVKYVNASGFLKIKDDIVSIMFIAIGRGNIDGMFETTDGVQVSLETPISSQNNPPAYNKLMSKSEVPFDKELFDLIKGMKVKYISEMRAGRIGGGPIRESDRINIKPVERKPTK